MLQNLEKIRTSCLTKFKEIDSVGIQVLEYLTSLLVVLGSNPSGSRSLSHSFHKSAVEFKKCVTTFDFVNIYFFFLKFQFRGVILEVNLGPVGVICNKDRL